MIMEEMVPLAYGGSLTNDTQADLLLQRIGSAVSSSPTSCSDYIPAAYLSDAACKTWLKTDMGYVMRKRPTPNYTAAESYYSEAIALTPTDCAPQSYLTELRVQMGNQTTADVQFGVACEACGKTPHSLDMADVRAAYAEKGWATPTDSSCVPQAVTSDELGPNGGAGVAHGAALPALISALVCAMLAARPWGS